MNCEDVRSKLGLYMEKELDPFLSKQIKKHLESCTTCQNELETLTKTLQIIKSVKVPPLPRDYSKIKLPEG